jgi:hypothetical protein
LRGFWLSSEARQSAGRQEGSKAEVWREEVEVRNNYSVVLCDWLKVLVIFPNSAQQLELVSEEGLCCMGSQVTLCSFWMTRRHPTLYLK